MLPMDDTHTYFYFIAFGGETCPDTEFWRKFLGLQPGVDLEPGFINKRQRNNNYLQDRQAMKLGNFTGIRGIPNQDVVMWETMGPIADRSLDRLGASDLAIVEFRNQMVEAAKAYQMDGTVIGRTEPRIPHRFVRSFEGVAPKSTDWRTAGVSDEEKGDHGRRAGCERCGIGRRPLKLQQPCPVGCAGNSVVLDFPCSGCVQCVLSCVFLLLPHSPFRSLLRACTPPAAPEMSAEGVRALKLRIGRSARRPERALVAGRRTGRHRQGPAAWR